MPESPQVQLEREIIAGSRQRALLAMSNKEARGQANLNPYARPLYRRFMFSLKRVIEAEVAQAGNPGQFRAHVGLVKDLDPATAAYITIHDVLSMLMEDAGVAVRKVARAIGNNLYRELILSLYEDINPEDYWVLMRDIDQRHSHDARYRYRVVCNRLTGQNITIPEWSNAQREQVGIWMIDQVRQLGLVTVTRLEHKALSGPTKTYIMDMAPAVKEIIQSVREVVATLSPEHQPMIEPPRPWTGFSGGGYYTTEMQRSLPFCVRLHRTCSAAVLDVYRNADMRVPLAALNHLQQVPWRINGRVLDVLKACPRFFETEEAIGQFDKSPPPPRPEWLPDDPKALPKSQMTEEQLLEFKVWKRAMAGWYTSTRLHDTRWGRYHKAVTIAEKFRKYPRIWFPYQMDFRGRMYAVSAGVSPQGSDMQKALLQFAVGKPLPDDRAVWWFKVAGANRFGVDKVSFDERVQWVDERKDLICAIAEDPLAHREWLDADGQFEFLAWAFEYADWCKDPEHFVSYLPVGLDGSCNGLQHFSALLRDQVGGKATNLVPGAKPNDIYQQVADVVQRKLQALDYSTLDEKTAVVARKWQAHGMNRKLVKRSVMTLPYGSTRFSCAEFILQDYVHHGMAPEFEPGETSRAANFLSHLIWDAIGEVVIAASTAMAWLRRCASAIIRSGEQTITWTSPSGFPVVQVYNKIAFESVRALLFGGVRIRVGSSGPDPDVRVHKNGISPNFVHSCDAAHLALTTVACKAAGIMNLAMIHDDYGTHAADVQQLYDLIRETFVRMYEQHDPIGDFYLHYRDRPGVPDRPRRGELDIERVRDSAYFFA